MAPDPNDETNPLGFGLGGIPNDAPLLREIQRVMLSSTGPVNWELARQIGVATASWGGDDPAPTDADRRELEETARAAELAVAGFTGLSGPSEVSPTQAVRRAGWVEANVGALKDLIDPIAAKMTAALKDQGLRSSGEPGPRFLPGFTGGPVPPSSEETAESLQSAEMMQSLLGQVVPLLMGAQVGTVLGYLAQRVLGQFDLPVPRPGGGLLFVVPNIAGLERDWSLDRQEFRAWVALHEVIHRFEFAGPWVRAHFLALVRDLVEHADLDFSSLERQMEGMDLANPESMAEAFDGMGNVFGQATTREQQLRVDRVRAFIVTAEGCGEHVLTSVGRGMLRSFDRIQEAIRRHREGRHSDQALERLLGLELTPDQYLVGRQFCETVVERTDEATLARMWESAESLPSMPELVEPTLWLSRIA